MAGRPAEKPITDPFTLKLMDVTDSETLQDLEGAVKVKKSTLRGWAFRETSPLVYLELVKNLVDGTGMTLDELVLEARKAEALVK